MAEGIEVSLKGDGPSWGGIGDASAMSPTVGGPFSVLRNVIHSRDGTELRRAPGIAVSGSPGYLDRDELDQTALTIVSKTPGNPTLLELSGFHHVSLTAPAMIVYIAGNADIPTGYYTAARGASATQLSVAVDTTAGTGAGGGTVLVQQGYQLFGWPHGMEEVDGYPVVVGDVAVSDGATGLEFFRHLASWVGKLPLNFDAPEERWPNWFSPVAQPHKLGITEPPPEPRVDFPIRRRAGLDVAGGGLIIAAPGSGCCLTTDIFARRTGIAANPAGTRLVGGITRALGTPTAVMVSAVASSGAGSLQADTTYYVSVAFKLKSTGEYGRAAEPLLVSTAGLTNPIITIEYHTPRRLLLESGDYSVVLFISTPGAQGKGALRPVLVENAPRNFGSHSLPIFLDIPIGTRYPVFEEMPMGASVARTIRGVTLFGGMMSSVVDDKETESERLAVSLFSGTEFDLVETGVTTKGAMNARFLLASGLTGLEVIAQNTAASHQGYLDQKVNGLGAHRWTLDGAFWDLIGTSHSLIVLMPRGQVWFSEQDHPGIAPSSSRVIIDAIRERDIRGMARIGNYVLAMTDEATYQIPWGRSLIGTDPVVVSTDYGCIARDSVVEFNGNAAWFSKSGIVGFFGGIRWIGAPVHSFFQSLKRDSRGEMPHVFGVHDPERRLIMWGVRTDWDADLYPAQGHQPLGAPTFLTIDDQRSRIPCDEILVWAYEVNAWSVVRYSGGKPFLDAKRMLHVDGRKHTSLLLFEPPVVINPSLIHHHRIFTMGDGFSNRSKTSRESIATSGPVNIALSGVYFTGSAGDFADLALGDQAYLVDQSGNLLWYGTLSFGNNPDKSDALLVGVAYGTVRWTAGATLVSSCIHMELETSFSRFGTWSQQSIISALSVRARREGGTHAWIDLRLQSETGAEQSMVPVGVRGVPLRESLTRFDLAGKRGNDHKIKITVISNGAVAIKDIALEFDRQEA